MRSLRLTCCLMCLACILPGQAGQPPVAAQLNGLEDIVDVALGGTVIVVLKADGTVWEVYSSTPPAQVPELNGVVRIAAGICHSMALKEDGTVWEWPGPWNAPVPQPADFDSRPYLIQGVTDVMSIAAGETRSLGVKSDGTVWEWSTPRAGCSFVPVRQPMQVSGLEEVVKVAVAYEAWMHTLFDSRGVALKKDGTIWAWNSGEMETAPAPIEDLAGMVDVSASPAGDVALREDGTVWQWDASLKPGQVNGLEIGRAHV